MMASMEFMGCRNCLPMEKIYAICPIPANKILPKAIIVLFILSVLLISIFINPQETNLLSCRFKQLTGYSCPTCGLTRSFHALSHMDFQDSFRFHLLGPFIYAVLLFVLIKFSIEIVTGKEIKFKINPKPARISIILFFCTLLCFWLIRFIGEIK